MYRNIDGKVTNKKILQIRKNSAITLFCFSMSMILVGVIIFPILKIELFNDDPHSFLKYILYDSIYSYSSLNNFCIFYLFCTVLGILGILVGFVEMCSLNFRKFVVRHAYIIEEDIENKLENLDTCET